MGDQDDRMVVNGGDECDWPHRWDDIDKLLVRKGPMSHPDFEPNILNRTEFLQKQAKILVIGAGGLGCELLKNLALSGFRNIDVIDMDTIDVSNLNRQFLFRASDVGKSKAEVAAAFINKRVKGCTVTPHNKMIQDYGASFYSEFNVIVCGLDSIPARRWINAMVHSIVEYENDDEGNATIPTGIIPIIDGGSEGFKGQARVIIPSFSACFECTLSTFPKQTVYPLCTIATTPRLPEHCIEYAKIIMWPKEFTDTDLDTDNPDHIDWLFQKAAERAAQFKIQGVTRSLTQGVVKNIIPAVASTNAIIAGACALEVFKLTTNCNPPLNNYCFYNGVEGAYTHTFEYEKDENCIVCSRKPRNVTCAPTMKLAAFCELLDAELQMKSPSVRTSDRTLYMSNPEALRLQTAPNLEKTLAELGVTEGTQMSITDPAVPNGATVIVRFS